LSTLSVEDDEISADMSVEDIDRVTNERRTGVEDVEINNEPVPMSKTETKIKRAGEHLAEATEAK
jgi:hypothetical protein